MTAAGVLTLAATLVSAALLALLRHGDPKRRRTAGLPGAGQSPATRRLLAAAALLPGLLLALTGDAPGFLVWLGCSATFGWLLAQWRAGHGTARR